LSNVAKPAAQMHRTKYAGIPETLAEIADPALTALVVYDMQVGILGQLPHGREVLAHVLDLLATARTADVPIFFTRHMSLPNKLAGTFQLRQAMAWQRVKSPEDVKPWFLRGDPGFELVPELALRDDEAIFDKLAMSAFEGTPLSTAIRDLGRQSFVICGVATEIGIEPTVRHGADLGLIPVVVRDACGAGHVEAAERSLAQFEFMGDAVMCTIAEVAAVWAR
jgi:nicotinamidase-related amidase